MSLDEDDLPPDMPRLTYDERTKRLQGRRNLMLLAMAATDADQHNRWLGWTGDAGIAVVHFDADGRADAKAFLAACRRPESMLTRLRRWLGR